MSWPRSHGLQLLDPCHLIVSTPRPCFPRRPGIPASETGGLPLHSRPARNVMTRSRTAAVESKARRASPPHLRNLDPYQACHALDRTRPLGAHRFGSGHRDKLKYSLFSPPGLRSDGNCSILHDSFYFRITFILFRARPVCAPSSLIFTESNRTRSFFPAGSLPVTFFHQELGSQQETTTFFQKCSSSLSPSCPSWAPLKLWWHPEPSHSTTSLFPTTMAHTRL